MAFVRAVMLHCFTDELLEKKTISQLNESHVDEITGTVTKLLVAKLKINAVFLKNSDATMANFTHYHTRKDSTAQSLNRPTVRTFISNMLQARKKQTQKRTRKT